MKEGMKTTFAIGGAILAFVGGVFARPALEKAYDKIKGKIQKRKCNTPETDDSSENGK